jgi:adenylate cyclase
MASTRRLAAILAADVAGYSRLMGADEEGTHERLRAHLAELVHHKIAEHRGRVVKNTGDGLLAEFASVVDAVRCAVEMQRGMAERNEGIAAPGRIEFRIGINLGDVIAEDEDIFGDGVNIAARLEALAEPGGICVSRMVRDSVRDKVDYAFDDLGEQQVKNITRPVRVYALRPGAVADPPGSSLPPVASILRPLVAPRLSIVVLPFANLSNDPEQQYFADGITEDLTTDLSRLHGMLVISHNTALTYRNRPADTKQIGRELAVRYVLEGSVRRSGSQVRINAQLIDAETDAHLWAERFDRDIGDLFAVQDEITGQIAFTLNLELVAAETRRLAEHPDALDYIFRGRAMFHGRSPSHENYRAAIALYEQALVLDPQSAEAKTFLAGTLVNDVISFHPKSSAADLARGGQLIDEILKTSAKIPWAHYVKGTILRVKEQWPDAINEFEAALTLNRNMTGPLQGLGWCKLFTGSFDEVAPLAEKALRIGPRDPGIGFRYLIIGEVHELQARPNEAIIWFEKARATISAVPGLHSRLASAYALAGDTKRAAAELAEAHRLNAGLFSSIAHLKASQTWGVPKVQALFEATYFAGLRKAGMPEK